MTVVAQLVMVSVMVSVTVEMVEFAGINQAWAAAAIARTARNCILSVVFFFGVIKS